MAIRHDAEWHEHNGTEAEWILERLTIDGSLPELTAYLFPNMTDADAPNAKTTKRVKAGTAVNCNISMYKGKDLLSEAKWSGKGTDQFLWTNFV